MKDDKSTAERLREEIEHYAKVVKVHDLPPIFHYWSNKYIRPRVERFGFVTACQMYCTYIKRVASEIDGECKILSIGAGNCDVEIDIAESVLKDGVMNVSFTCLDINPHMLQRGRELAQKKGLYEIFRFLETDINNWGLDTSYHIIIANQSLHHFVELELLFDKIYESLHPEGFFLSNDMIGRNGHMYWPEALELIHALWAVLDDKHKYNHQLKRFEVIYENWDCSIKSFEGIRAQDILPLLISKFQFDLFLGFSNVISVFVGRSFGHNFNLDDIRDRTIIDCIAKLDDYYIELGKIKPIQMYAVMTKKQRDAIRTYKHLTPEFCTRTPDGIEASQLPRETIIKRLVRVARRI